MIMSTIITQYLRQGIIPAFPTTAPASEKIVHASVAELASLGFIVHPDEISVLSEDTLSQVIDGARSVTGVGRFSTEPMYVNFPGQVKKMSTIELIVDQIVHYLSAGSIVPDEERTQVREGLSLADAVKGATRLRVEENDPWTEVRRRVLSPVAVSETDREIITLLVWTAFDGDLSTWISIYKDASNHENAQVLASALIDLAQDSDQVADITIELIRSTYRLDRLLRVVLSAYSTPSSEKNKDSWSTAVTDLSDAHAWAVKMSNAPKRFRRELVTAIGKNVARGAFGADPLIARKNLWRRVMRMVHPYSLNLSKEARTAMDILHGNIEYRTFNSSVEKALADKDVDTSIKLLSDRPGSLLRRVIALSRMDGFTRAHAVEIARSIENASTVPLTTMISAYNGVMNANVDGARIVTVKGRNAVVDEDRATAKYPSVIAEGILRGISHQLSRVKAPSAPVGVRGGFPVPLIARDTSSTDRVLHRGQVVTHFEDTDTLRLFIHWFNTGNRRTDVDLGLSIYDAGLSMITSANYTNYESSRSFLTFSGDLIDAPTPSGASEYFDLDILSLRRDKRNARWVALTAISYSGETFKNIDHVSGIMVREDADAGEIFEPRTVTASGASVADSRSVTTMIVDLEENTVIWADSSVGSREMYSNSTEQGGDIASVIRSLANRTSMDVGTLAEMWAKAHSVETVDEPVDINNLLAIL